MTTTLASASLDLAFLLLFWVPGILGAWALGARTVSLALPVGFVFSTTLLTLWYSLLALLGWHSDFWWSSKALFVMATVPLLFLAIKGRASLAITAWFPLAVATTTIVGRNILLLDTRPGFSDQFLVGYIGWLMQSGIDPTVLGSTSYLKRSFATPLLLAAGREGFLLISMIPLMAILLIIATYHLATVASARFPSWLRIVTFGAVMSLWATTSFFWGMFGYQNSHVLVALAVTTLASFVLILSSTTPPPLLLIGSGIFASSFVLAQARIEAAALALLIALPLLNALPRMTTRHSRVIILALSGGPIGFIVWLVTTRSPVVEPLPLIALMILLVPFIILAAIGRVPAYLGKMILPTTFGVLAGLGIWYLFVVGDGRLRRQFIQNTFLGDGRWGYIAGAFLIILAITIVRHRSQRDNWVIWMTVTGLLFTLDVKILDGLIELGQITGIGRGWTDSVNRGFFHLFGPLTVMAMTGILGLAGQQERPKAKETVRKSGDSASSPAG